MTAVLIALIGVLAAALLLLGLRHRRLSTGRPGRLPDQPARRILFPFVASSLSQRALDAALRLARTENASLVPVFLARVPLHLPLDSALPRQSALAVQLQEAIEHRAADFDVPVDARIERGRSNRHALRQAIDRERFDRIVMAAATPEGDGFNPDDVAWLLDNASGEIVILRPDRDDRIEPAPVRPGRRRSSFRDGRSRHAAGRHRPGGRALTPSRQRSSEAPGVNDTPRSTCP